MFTFLAVKPHLMLLHAEVGGKCTKHCYSSFYESRLFVQKIRKRMHNVAHTGMRVFTRGQFLAAHLSEIKAHASAVCTLHLAFLKIKLFSKLFLFPFRKKKTLCCAVRAMIHYIKDTYACIYL